MALLVTLVCLFMAFPLSAVAAVIQGMILLANHTVGEGLWDIGSGIMMAGFTLLLWKPILLGIKHSTLGLLRLCKLCINNLLGRRNQA